MNLTLQAYLLLIPLPLITSLHITEDEKQGDRNNRFNRKGDVVNHFFWLAENGKSLSPSNLVPMHRSWCGHHPPTVMPTANDKNCTSTWASRCTLTVKPGLCAQHAVTALHLALFSCHLPTQELSSQAASGAQSSRTELRTLSLHQWGQPFDL